MVRLRLKRTGRRHRPSYRLSAMDQRSPRNGRVIEELGLYDPCHENPEQRLTLNTDRIAYWLARGAQPSDTVRDMIKKAGIEPAKAASA